MVQDGAGVYIQMSLFWTHTFNFYSLDIFITCTGFTTVSQSVEITYSLYPIILWEYWRLENDTLNYVLVEYNTARYNSSNWNEMK